MRRIRCKDCGKSYDYDKDDFCPKCGAYNPPADSGATQLERELLSRFETGQQNQNRAKTRAQARVQETPRRTPPRTGQATPRAGKTAPTAAFHPTYGSTPEIGRQKHSGRIQGCAACEEPVKRSKAPLVILIVAVVILFVAVAVGLAVTMVRDAILDSGFGYSYLEPTARPEPASGEVWHGTWTDFYVNGAAVSVEDSWRLELDEGSRYYREGYDCLLVDVWITGGTPQEDLLIDTPCVLLSDGTEIPLADDAFLARSMKNDYGVYAVSLRDCQWEDPLYGSFLFFVPEDEEDFVLRINEYDPGDTEADAPRAVHYIPLDSWL